MLDFFLLDGIFWMEINLASMTLRVIPSPQDEPLGEPGSSVWVEEGTNGFTFAVSSPDSGRKSLWRAKEKKQKEGTMNKWVIFFPGKP